MDKRGVPEGRGFLLFLAVFFLFFSIAGAEEIRYDKGSRRDPFVPLVGPNAPRGFDGSGKDGFQIEGIVYDPRQASYAVIGGEIYREGETVEGAQLVKVLPDRVILLQQNEEVVVWLREEIFSPNKEKAPAEEKGK